MRLPLNEKRSLLAMLLAFVALGVAGSSVVALAQPHGGGPDDARRIDDAVADVMSASGPGSGQAGRVDAFEAEAARIAADGERLAAEGRDGAGDIAVGHEAAVRRGMGQEATASPGVGEVEDSGPAFYVFVSLSMPRAMLAEIVHDATAAGGRVVMRGLPPASNGVAAMTRLREALGAAGAGVEIDPLAFRAFGVTAVPTFVTAMEAVDPCDELDCTPVTPVHDKVSGGIPVRSALEILQAEGAAGSVARMALARLAENE